MQLSDRVYALPLTLELKDRALALHPVVVETRRGVLLVDAGWPGSVDQLEACHEDVGFGWDDVWDTLLTHQDVDHTGGLVDVVDRADPVVFAHEKCARYVAGREHPVKMDSKRYPAASVDVELSAGDRFSTAAGPMEFVFTPGHAPGHLSLYFPAERLLVSGDALHAPTVDLDGPRGPPRRSAGNQFDWYPLGSQSSGLCATTVGSPTTGRTRSKRSTQG